MKEEDDEGLEEENGTSLVGGGRSFVVFVEEKDKVEGEIGLLVMVEEVLDLNGVADKGGWLAALAKSFNQKEKKRKGKKRTQFSTTLTSTRCYSSR